MWWQLWWVWVVGGLAIGALEMVVPGYIFVGFAIGAVATGLLAGIGVLAGSPAVMLAVFALLSLAAWLGLRRAMGKRKGQVKIWTRDINDNP
jgi:membrane protein implicated in regulation of membrane protease activity